MPKKAGRRVQIKRITFQIKEAIIKNQDPLPLYLKLHTLKSNPTPKRFEYKLIPIHFEINYPHWKTIKKTDPRRKTYKIRYLFGPED